jgi:hypothetical protein
VRLPVAEMTYSVLFEGREPEEAILELMMSPLEVDGH